MADKSISGAEALRRSREALFGAKCVGELSEREQWIIWRPSRDLFPSSQLLSERERALAKVKECNDQLEYARACLEDRLKAEGERIRGRAFHIRGLIPGAVFETALADIVARSAKPRWADGDTKQPLDDAAVAAAPAAGPMIGVTPATAVAAPVAGSNVVPIKRDHAPSNRAAGVRGTRRFKTGHEPVKSDAARAAMRSFALDGPGTLQQLEDMQPRYLVKQFGHLIGRTSLSPLRDKVVSELQHRQIVTIDK